MKTVYRSFLYSVSWILGGIAGIAFFWGGHAINEFFKVDRISAEVLGLGIAVVCGTISFAAKSTLEDMDVIEENEKAMRAEETGQQG